MSENSTKKLYRVNELSSEQLYAILDEIPSDNESEIISDETRNQDDVFNIEEMDVIFADDVVEDVVLENVTQNDPESVWDSDDEMSLANLTNSCLNHNNNEEVWTSDISNCTIPNLFTEPYGPNIPDTAEYPVDVFLHLFPIELIEQIVFQTNLYAVQTKGASTHSFVPTTVEEIKVFLGVNILMGIKKLPSYRDYWSSTDQMRDSYISSSITRNRFEWLLSFLHLNDNERQPKRHEKDFDKLYKLRPMLDKLSKTFLSSMNPNENQSVDESMIRFKGRSSIRQYMPMKPIKRGYKVWIRADSTGYVCQFEIYTGKIKDTCEKNLGMRVITDLTKCIIGKYHKVYFDNFFNSVPLQKYLLDNGIYACGTVRKHRKGMPELISDKRLKRGDCDWRVSSSGLVHVKWVDRKPVLFLGNFHNPTEMQSVARRRKDGTQENISCPSIVKDYNRNMGYVDKFDMLKSLYEIDRKSHKWWHRIFFYFVDVCVVNAYILYQERLKSSMTTKEFRLLVATGLIGANRNQALRKRVRKNVETPNNYKKKIPLELRYDKNAHMPKRSTSVRCAHCSTREEPHRSMWKCSTCDIGLCLNDKRNCFAAYHTE